MILFVVCGFLVFGRQSATELFDLFHARGRGGGGWVNLGVILVRVCEPVFQKLPYSYTWPLIFCTPFFAGC